MPTNPQVFQKSRKPWSRWKHKILEEYLKAMVSILRKYGKIFYVDGFAGPGRYTDDGVEGSPLLAARFAARLRAQRLGYSLQCINVESDLPVYENLSEETRAFTDYVRSYNGKFGDYIDAILQEIEDNPAIFFLDPIGLKGLEWDSLAPIFQRSSTTELLIRFDAQTALRLTGSDANLHSTFNEILGEDTSALWKRTLAESHDSARAKRECLTYLYAHKLRNYFEYVGVIPIHSVDDQVKYYMLFATRHIKGVQAMNDVLYRIKNLRDRTLDIERRAQHLPRQMGMFEPSAVESTRYELDVLKAVVLKILGDGETYRRDSLRGLVATKADNFGRYSMSHFTAILGGRPKDIEVPTDFESLKAKVQILNGLTVGNDKVEISLAR